MKVKTYCQWPSILTYLALLVVAFPASAVTYQTPYDSSSWETEGGRLECHLSHEVTGYGKATFGQKAGKRQTLALHSTIGRLNQGDIAVFIASPSWQPKKSKWLVTVPAKKGLQPLALKKRTVYQALTALEHGQDIVIKFCPSNLSVNLDACTQDKVILSPIGFKAAYQEYLACVDHLVPYTFEELNEGTFHFGSGSLALSEEDTALLNAMIDYVNNDPHVYKIKLKGHSDSKGSFTDNRQLSYERAWHIKDLMVFKGVDPDLFEIKGMADREPIGKNKTREGRAKNRRVEISIHR